MNKGVFGISIDEGVVRENIGVLSEVEGDLGTVEETTFGVEEGEVIGEVGGGWDETLEVKGMEGFACNQISLGYTSFEKVAEGLNLKGVHALHGNSRCG